MGSDEVVHVINNIRFDHRPGATDALFGRLEDNFYPAPQLIGIFTEEDGKAEPDGRVNIMTASMHVLIDRTEMILVWKMIFIFTFVNRQCIHIHPECHSRPRRPGIQYANDPCVAFFEVRQILFHRPVGLCPFMVTGCRLLIGFAHAEIRMHDCPAQLNFKPKFLELVRHYGRRPHLHEPKFRMFMKVPSPSDQLILKIFHFFTS